ncbi:hypothetical protein TR631_12395 [Streptomyces rochei]|uniref:hypothetical protein n=1 Tax=Streptomyces rochei TaxID=1928 RepID=UPI002ACE9079|nr:hypothetical protein [Streptomyces rochei]WQC12567.1 hypothetical protein TR631_12395 [Streptomyces rochei]
MHQPLRQITGHAHGSSWNVKGWTLTIRSTDAACASPATALRPRAISPEAGQQSSGGDLGVPKGKGGRIRGIVAGRGKVYEALKSRMGKTRAAKIANAGQTKADRSRMAKKAARTRRQNGQ